MIGTKCHGVMFGSEHGDPLIVEYVDLNYICNMDDRRSKTFIFNLL